MNAQDFLTKPHQRTGQGFDVHAFDKDEHTPSHIMLFGCSIPFHRKLKGHSDADVGLHALCDAIYGICANGDIGTHFPPSNEAHKGQDSADFLIHALYLLSRCGGILIHIDVTLIGEEPKMRAHRTTVLSRLQELTGLAASQIGLKATTTEKLGFTGRKEGLACMAVATAHFENGFISAADTEGAPA